jgi:pSer/pThr/pTyr-binding forkhead associated (FHA) protein
VLLRISAAGQSVSLNDTEIVLGRSPFCTIVLADGSVSRVHATLRRRSDRVLVTDAGSRNGTFVNGMRITSPTAVLPGDRIVLGDVPVVLEAFEHGATGNTRPVPELPEEVPSEPTRRHSIPAPKPPR